MDVLEAWRALGDLASRFYAAGDGASATAERTWFAALSRAPSSELNVCGVYRDAPPEVAQVLLDRLEDLPAIIFTDSAAAPCRDLLTAAGFDVTEVAEPLMHCRVAPVAAPARFEVVRGAGEDDLAAALDLTAEAHQVDRALLDRTIAASARAGDSVIWLAREAGTPVSVVWLARAGATVGVMEMMTPARLQGRGAGRAVLSTALADAWVHGATDAVLLATPAGRRLYESIGFTAVDESLTCYRGPDDGVLSAIGQVSGG